MEPFIFLDTTSFRDFKVVHYCRLFEHRVARWTYLPNYIFWVKYRIRCSIYSSYRSSSVCCHRNNSNFKLCVTKANSYNITITYVFPLIYYCPCLVQLLSGMPFHSQNITKIKLIKIGSGDESSTVYFYYTCCFNNASNSSKLCTSYVGIIPLSFNFLSGLNQQVSIPLHIHL